MLMFSVTVVFIDYPLFIALVPDKPSIKLGRQFSGALYATVVINL